MIGIIAKDHEAEIVSEFFQLFKTPWEFCDNKTFYDVVISTNSDISSINAKVIIVFDSNEIASKEQQPPHDTSRGTTLVKSGDLILPIYGDIQKISDNGLPIITELNNSNVIGIAIANDEKRIIKIGYGLFREIEFLLTNGQPPENAHIPTLEYHISILRKLILDAGVTFLEIPPTPAGYKVITCLTHDVDSVRIRDHKMDHTVLGFLYRATFGTFLNNIRRKSPWSNLVKNVKAVLSIPLVYLGLCKDFWLQFDRYIEIEKELPSTYFLIPFKNKVGERVSSPIRKRRATKYEITDVVSEVNKLMKNRDEIGVHGIDAWHNEELARIELNRISQVTQKPQSGIRMHWLCFDNNSFNILDKAGFLYDSTFGYNEAIGFRGGTTQVFRPLTTTHLLELPLHIQDTALFSSHRKHLSQTEAWIECKKIIKTAITCSGVLTILWHLRSIAPEKLYDDFYIAVIEYLRKHDTWFATGEQAIQWFKKRRDFNFKTISYDHTAIKVQYSGHSGTKTTPPLILRVYKTKNATTSACNYKDIILSGDVNEIVSLNEN